MHEQIDRVTVGGSLGPVLANIIMTECKKVIVDKLAKEKVIMYFTRYVDDTFLIIKNRDINYVLNQFNKFDKKLKFTIDTFENSFQHFLLIEIVEMDLVFIINITKLVSMYWLPPIHYGDGKFFGSVH